MYNEINNVLEYDDSVVGKANEVASYIICNFSDDIKDDSIHIDSCIVSLETLIELLKRLKKLDNALVKVIENPVGTYTIKELKEED